MAERFDFETLLGSGGYGDVFYAFDRLRNEHVAVKVMRRASSAHMRMLKREFRSLADVVHPNLVTLHELVSDGTDWCITMEFIDGVDLLRFSHGAVSRAAAGLASERATTDVSPTDSGFDPRIVRRASEHPPAVDLGRLRGVLVQVAEAIAALHAEGRLHRDIKPSNVMVTAEGRAVVLDFGLVMDLTPDAPPNDGLGLGTMGYMSPEQLLGMPLDAASDWYSFGATVFELLTGQLPFEGRALQVAFRKNFAAPPDPRLYAPEAPADLSALCAALLASEPAARPTGADVLRALGHGVAPPPARPRPAAPGLLGREPEVAALSASFAVAARGTPALVTVSGPSGIGKSALVQQHLSALHADRSALVLSGRCYERESVPYNALEGVIEELSARLRDNPDTVDAALSQAATTITRLFPSLASVPGLVPARFRSGSIAIDPWEIRRAAAAGLRALIQRVAAERPVVIAIDDLHWADADSAELLRELLRPGALRTLQLIVSYRPEGRATNPCVRMLLDDPLGLDARALDLAALPAAACSALATLSLGRDDPEAARRVAEESLGNPFFIMELGRHLHEAGPLAPRLSLDDVVRARVARVPESARRLVEVVALAGGALPTSVAFRAVGAAGAYASLSVLRSGSLVRSLGEDGALLITFHDRIREAITAGLSAADVRAAHARLALAWESERDPEPEVLYTHHLAAGATDRAAHFAALAARRASDALAFDHAARLYRQALALGRHAAAEHRALQRDLALALSDAGRGRDSAEAWLAAAEGAPADERVDRERHAAEQLLRSGYIDEGIAVATRVLDAVGVALPSTTARSLVSLVTHRARVVARGTSFTPRSAADCDPARLARFDACWSVAAGISVIDVARAASLHSLSLLLALDLGEPARLSQALSMEAGFHAMAGPGSRAHAARMLRDARGLAERIDNPDALALVEVMEGVSSWGAGRWALAAAAFGRAFEVIDQRCSGVAWERSTAMIFRLDARYYLGDWSALLAELPHMLADARERGDRYTETLASIRFECVAGLAADDPARAKRGLRRAKDWSQAGFHSVHLVELHETVEVALYEGRGAEAWRALDDRWWALERSLLLQVQAFRIQMRYLRGRAALAAALAADSASARWWYARVAASDAARCEREKSLWGDGLASLLRAGVASLRGERAAASDAAARSARLLDAAEMRVHATVARRLRASLDGDAAAVAAADAVMTSEGVVNAGRMASMLAPVAL